MGRELRCQACAVAVLRARAAKTTPEEWNRPDLSAWHPNRKNWRTWPKRWNCCRSFRTTVWQFWRARASTQVRNSTQWPSKESVHLPSPGMILDCVLRVQHGSSWPSPCRSSELFIRWRCWLCLTNKISGGCGEREDCRFLIWTLYAIHLVPKGMTLQIRPEILFFQEREYTVNFPRWEEREMMLFLVPSG